MKTPIALAIFFIGLTNLIRCADNSDTYQPSNPSSPVVVDTMLYIKDTMVVRAILDSNHLDSIPVNQVAAVYPGTGRIDTLFFSNLTITVIPPVIDSLTELTSLTITRTPLEYLPPAIGSLIKLVSLKLNDNALQALPPEIGSCVKLSELYIFKNHITKIPDSFRSLTNLTTIEMSNNDIDSLPAWLTKLPNLSSIDLDSNSLCSITDSTMLSWINSKTVTLKWQPTQKCANRTKDLTLVDSILNFYAIDTGSADQVISISGGRVVSLDLSNRNLSTFYSGIYKLTGLTTLYMNNNPIGTIPPGIDSLKNVVVINFSNDSLVSIPPMDSLDNLRSLFLGGNSLTSLDGVIPDSLDTLVAAGNRISALPATIGDDSLLRYLDMTNNNLDSLPPTITSLSRVSIKIGGNKLCTALPILQEYWLALHVQGDTSQICSK